MVKKVKQGPETESVFGGFIEIGRRNLATIPNYIRSTQDIGKAIKTARKAKKINQQTLADLANVGRRFVSELENGKPTLEFDKVINVASAVGIDLLVQKR